MNKKERVRIVKLYKAIDEKLREKKFYSVACLRYHCYTVAERVAWLRITFPARDKVDGWKGFLNKTRKQIIEEGRNSDKLLFGLDT